MTTRVIAKCPECGRLTSTAVGRVCGECHDRISAEFADACSFISEECVEEGYPSHGSNYELRVDEEYSSFRERYPGWR